jgi:hypothetical protein
MEQMTLFHPHREETVFVPRPAAPFVVGSPTSKKAAASIAGMSRSQRQAILEFFKLRGAHGATDEEVCEFLKLSANTERPRRGELVSSGLVVDSGRTRLTRSRRPAVVWTIATAIEKDLGSIEPLPF